MRRVVLLVTAVSLMLAGSAGRANTGSLQSVLQGSRPGPAVLYEPLASAPQLSNGPGWSAAPIMVSGAQAYDGGEYLYQDYVYDDYGANTNDAPLAQPDSVPNEADILFGGMTGDFAYPTDTATFANDAADLLELRARLDGNGNVVYRVTLNTMISNAAAAVAIGVDNAPGGTDDWGYGIGSLGDLNLDEVLVGTGGDPATNQIEIATNLKPNGATWRHYVVVGLWNGSAFTPVLDQPTATQPGGANGKNPPPVFNVGFRFAEPAVNGDLNGLITNPTGSNGSRTTGAGNWRDHAQALALAARDISAMHADIDFSKVAAAANDDSGVPKTGFLSRLYASHLDLGEGAQPTRPMLLGKIQPYGVYVPTTYTGEEPAPFVLALHSLSCSYNQYAVFAPNLYRDLGEDRGAIMLTTEGRGPDGWYHDEAETDLFEAWADVAAHYSLDPDQVAINGYSMGGYATWKFASQYPDLFNAAFGVVGPGDEAIQGAPTGGNSEDNQNTMHILDNLRNVPLMMWHGVNDELVPLAGALQMAKRMRDLGYEHEVDVFPGFDHFLFSLVDEWDRGKDWIDRPSLNIDPHHITYRAMPEMDNAALGLVHDHAYWVSDIRVAAGSRDGLVDVVSAVDGAPEPQLDNITPIGTVPAPHIASGYGPTGGTVVRPAGNRLDCVLEGVSSVTVWVDRAGLSAGTITLNVNSTTPVTIKLRGSVNADVTMPTGISSASV